MERKVGHGGWRGDLPGALLLSDPLLEELLATVSVRGLCVWGECD